MRLEVRTTFGLPSLILIPDEDESILIDKVMGDRVGEDGLIADVAGQVKLSDGYGQHYIELKPLPKKG